MAIFEKVPFVNRFYRTKAEPQLDQEVVSTVGFTNFWNMDGVQYNPDQIRIDTYDKIYKNHQVKACLNIIRFSLQKVDWFIQSEDEEVREVVTYALEKIWNKLMKSISKSFRYGFSPSVKVFTLKEIKGKQYIVYDKIKDLHPKDCSVIVDEYGNYNGFEYKKGSPEFYKKIDPRYSFWFSNDMENGNLYGQSMLADVYKPWYYSEKVHNFANRYYERFGEPLVVGRAPSGAAKVKDAQGNTRSAQEMMDAVISNIRSHASAQLPSEKDEQGKDYLYTLEYLESQMRGFDFDNYLKRLDMEITRGLLVPDLMFQSGSGGSYALGSAQIEAFYTNLMGIMDNVVDYVNNYIIPQLVEYNFGKEKSAKIAYEPLSVEAKKFINEMILALINASKLMPDIGQLEERSGYKLKEQTPPKNTVTKEEVKKDIAKNNKELSETLKAEAERIAKVTLLSRELEEVAELKSQLEEADE